MKREYVAEFLNQKVTVGVPSNKSRPYYFTGELISVDKEFLTITYQNGYKSIKLDEVIEIQLGGR